MPSTNFLTPFFASRRSARTRACGLLAVCILALGACTAENEQNAAAFLERAKQFSAAGDTAAAVVELKNALQREPGLNEARWLLGLAYLASYNGALAESQFDRLRAASFTHEDLDAAYFRALLQQARYDDILSGALGNNDPGVLVALGEANLGTSDFETGPRARKVRQAYIDTAQSRFEKALAIDPGHYEAHLGLARIALWKKQFEAAATLIGQAETLHPDRAGAPILRGMLGQLTANPVAAEAAYTSALERSPGDLLALVGLARVLIAQGKTAAADQVTSRLFRAHPGLPVAAYLRAYALVQDDKPDQAVGILQKLLAREPGNAEGARLLATTLVNLGQLEQAATLAHDILARNPDDNYARRALAEVDLKRGDTDAALAALRGMPGDYRALELLGRTHIGLGNEERGNWYLAQARVVAMQQATERGTAPTSLWANHIQEAINAAAYDTAVTAAKRLLARRPDDPDAHHAAGAAYLAGGDEKSARDAFHAALRLEPQHVPSLLSLAELDSANDEFAIARLRYERALEVERTNARALVGIARLEARSGAPEVAQRQLEQVLNINEQHAPALLELANLARLAGDEESTLSYLDAAARASPDDADAKFLRAKYEFDRGNTGPAKSALTEALRTNPNHAAAQLLLSEIRFLDGDLEAATRIARTLAQREPGNPDAQRALAIAQMRANEFEDARRSLSRALEIDPEHEHALATACELELRVRDFAAAKTAAERLIAAAPESGLGYKLLGDQQLAQNRVDEAAAQYAIARAKPDGATYAARNLFALASAYQRNGRPADAISVYRQIVALQPDNASALNELAWLLHLAGDPEAEVTAGRAYALQSGNAAIADTYGWILINETAADAVARGVKVLREAVQAAPAEPTLRYHLAVGLVALDETTAALAELDLALRAGQFADRQAAQRLRATLADANE